MCTFSLLPFSAAPLCLAASTSAQTRYEGAHHGVTGMKTCSRRRLRLTHSTSLSARRCVGSAGGSNLTHLLWCSCGRVQQTEKVHAILPCSRRSSRWYQTHTRRCTRCGGSSSLEARWCSPCLLQRCGGGGKGKARGAAAGWHQQVWKSQAIEQLACATIFLPHLPVTHHWLLPSAVECRVTTMMKSAQVCRMERWCITSLHSTLVVSWGWAAREVDGSPCTTSACLTAVLAGALHAGLAPAYPCPPGCPTRRPSAP